MMSNKFLILAIIFILALAGIAFGGILPDNTPMNYYKLDQFKTLKTDSSRVIPWVRIITLEKPGEASSEKEVYIERLILVVDNRIIGDSKDFRIIAIWHWHQQKKEKRNIIKGCYADIAYPESLGETKPDWINFNTENNKMCQLEIDNFLFILDRVYEVYEKNKEKALV